MYTFEQKYENLSDLVAELRDEIYVVDPDYFNGWVGEFIHSPEVCLERVILWLNDEDKMTSEET